MLEEWAKESHLSDDLAQYNTSALNSTPNSTYCKNPKAEPALLEVKICFLFVRPCYSLIVRGFTFCRLTSFSIVHSITLFPS
jgi:hypothetical protein